MWKLVRLLRNSTLTILLFVGLPQQLPAQVIRARAIPNWYWYSPADAIRARVIAFDEYARSLAAVNYQHARVVRAEAVSRELDNDLKAAQIYWQKKSLYEAEKLKRTVGRLEREMDVNYKTWGRLASHSELNRNEIVSGDGANFLLHRLAGTALSFNFGLLSKQEDQMLRNALRLEPSMLEGLKLRRVGSGGAHHTFRATSGTALDIRWWPTLLNGDGFKDLREEFETARRHVVDSAAQDSGITNESLEPLGTALWRLRARFDGQDHRGQMQTHGMEYGRKYCSAQRFLRSLQGEFRWLERTRDSRALDGTASFDIRLHGRDLISLLTFMSRNGIEFAPPDPGEDERAYYVVFAMMRDLYSVVAEDDPGVKERKNPFAAPHSGNFDLRHN